MTEPGLRGVERFIFGTESFEVVRDWLAKHIDAHLGAAIENITFRAGDIGAVFGLRLVDGREVVLKAARPEANRQRLRAAVSAQNQLAAAGFPCPSVLDGPSSTADITAVIEQVIGGASTGSPHNAATRMTMARALAWQIDVLRGVDGWALVPGRPGWTNWDSGAWPTPHDSIFDFSARVDGFEWLEEAADNAARVLQSIELPAVIGHSDWVWQNVCVRDEELLAGYDWDSLIYAPESAIVGVAASSFSQGSPVPPDAPSSSEIDAFIADYQTAAGRRFTDIEQRCARAAATWVRCYNARCQLDGSTRRNTAPPRGSFIDQLQAEFG